jgi:hypothetical protein
MPQQWQAFLQLFVGRRAVARDSTSSNQRNSPGAWSTPADRIGRISRLFSGRQTSQDDATGAAVGLPPNLQGKPPVHGSRFNFQGGYKQASRYQLKQDLLGSFSLDSKG